MILFLIKNGFVPHVNQVILAIKFIYLGIPTRHCRNLEANMYRKYPNVYKLGSLLGGRGGVNNMFIGVDGLRFWAILVPVSQIRALDGFRLGSYCTVPVLSDARVGFTNEKLKTAGFWMFVSRTVPVLEDLWTGLTDPTSANLEYFEKLSACRWLLL